jgi:hypothetical protein
MGPSFSPRADFRSVALRCFPSGAMWPFCVFGAKLNLLCDSAVTEPIMLSLHGNKAGETFYSKKNSTRFSSLIYKIGFLSP